MPDPVSAEEKGRWFTELTARQEQIAAERSAAMVGTRHRALIEQQADGYLEARLPDNEIVRVTGDAEIGTYVEVEITEARSWILMGRIV